MKVLSLDQIKRGSTYLYVAFYDPPNKTLCRVVKVESTYNIVVMNNVARGVDFVRHDSQYVGSDPGEKKYMQPNFRWGLRYIV